jgi:uncharacterized protein (TIGR02186 family)
MRRNIAALVVLLVSLGCVQPVAAERLIVSISRHQVLVTSSFTGTSIVLFGTVEPDTPTFRMRNAYDIVVTVTGPRQTLVTRRKERMFGIWANADSRTFVNVPNYLYVLANRPFDRLPTPIPCAGSRSESTISSFRSRSAPTSPTRSVKTRSA